MPPTKPPADWQAVRHRAKIVAITIFIAVSKKYVDVDSIAD
jgi:hypothetical protein